MVSSNILSIYTTKLYGVLLSIKAQIIDCQHHIILWHIAVTVFNWWISVNKLIPRALSAVSLARVFCQQCNCRNDTHLLILAALHVLGISETYIIPSGPPQLSRDVIRQCFNDRLFIKNLEPLTQWCELLRYSFFWRQQQMCNEIAEFILSGKSVHKISLCNLVSELETPSFLIILIPNLFAAWFKK